MSTSGAEITFVDLWRLKFDFPKCLCKPQRKAADGGEKKYCLFVFVLDGDHSQRCVSVHQIQLSQFHSNVGFSFVMGHPILLSFIFPFNTRWIFTV